MLLIKGFDFLIDFYKLLSMMYEIKDLTRVVISYEIYETSLRRVSLISYEMTTSVRFCLSYVPLKWDFFAFKMIIISIRNALLTRTLSMTLCLRAKVLLHVWSYDFYDMMISTE